MLTRINAATYATKDNAIKVHRQEKQTWTKGRGFHTSVKWVAILSYKGAAEIKAAAAEKRAVDCAAYTVAEGDTLEKVQQRLARYLSDVESGNLRTRHYYGFNQDARPVAR